MECINNINFILGLFKNWKVDSLGRFMQAEKQFVFKNTIYIIYIHHKYGSLTISLLPNNNDFSKEIILHESNNIPIQRIQKIKIIAVKKTLGFLKNNIYTRIEINEYKGLIDGKLNKISEL